MQSEIKIKPVGAIANERKELTDDFWGSVVSEIRIDESFPESSLNGIEKFSHLEIVFYFHRADESKIETGERHPRNNAAWPLTGIFAQRASLRPSKIGVTMVRLLERKGRTLKVIGLDAVDGTPVLDIKPVMKEFFPREKIRQPDWSSELMKHYWE